MEQLELPFEVRDMRHKEKFQVDDIYLNGYAKKVGVYGTAVYVSLCRHVDINQKCFPSIRKMAEEHNCSEKQIGRAIRDLEGLNIIKKVRMGKKLSNRYYLLDRSEWTNSPISRDCQSDHQGTGSPIHSKDTHIKDTQERRVSSFRKKLKPYYRGNPMRESPVGSGKWFVIDDGQWLEFAGQKSEIEYK